MILFQLQFEDDLKITKMFSGEGEEVDFIRTMYPTGNVEEWMLEIENCMKESMRLIIKAALEDYKVVSSMFRNILFIQKLLYRCKKMCYKCQ